MRKDSHRCDRALVLRGARTIAASSSLIQFLESICAAFDILDWNLKLRICTSPPSKSTARTGPRDTDGPIALVATAFHTTFFCQSQDPISI